MTMNIRDYINKSLAMQEIIELLEHLGMDVREVLLDGLEGYSDTLILKELEKMSYNVDSLWKEV